MAVPVDAAAWLALALVPGLGPSSFRRLLTAFGGPEQVCRASTAALSAVVKLSLAQAITAGAAQDKISASLDWLEQADNHLVTLADSDYPPALLQIHDPPPLLYLKGRRELLSRPAFAVVGSRNATAQGIDNAEAFALALSQAGLCVVSGLALGADAAAHRGGLQGNGSSIAIVGTGLDTVYPARNRTLAHQLASEGALVSEFGLGTPALASHFPRRNRLISGLCRGCLVVEAALSSGSLITARLALEQGRDVFAIPGSIHSPLSKGCHALIKQGAKLVESAADILEEIGMSIPTSAPLRLNSTTDPAAEQLLTAMGHDPCALEDLCARTGLSFENVTGTLLSLELDGLITMLPGARYQRRR